MTDGGGAAGRGKVSALARDSMEMDGPS
jgi:hypothetical protein